MRSAHFGRSSASVEYWQNHKYDVYLVIRTSDGDIRWMNVTEHLKRRKNKKSKQIVFDGETLTAFSLLRLRNEVLA